MFTHPRGLEPQRATQMRQPGRGTYHPQLHQRHHGCHNLSSTHAVSMAFADFKKSKDSGLLHVSARWIVSRRRVVLLSDSCANPRLCPVYAPSV